MNLNAVPQNLSVVAMIERPLKEIVKKIYDDMPFQADLRFVEEILSERESLLLNKALDPAFDWASDLRIARWHQKFALDWLPHHQDVRDRYIKFWREASDTSANYIREVALGGMKTLLLLHGAVALGGLNVISQGNGASNLILAAKLALGFSLIGIFALGAGQAIAISIVNDTNGKVLGRLSNKIRWSKARAIGRYRMKRHKPLKYADRLIYGSVFWFAAYTMILYAVIVS